MERENLERLATSLIEAFNASDWNGVADLVSPQMTYENRTTGSVVSGREGFTEAIKQFKGPRQDITGDMLSGWVVDEGTGAVAGELCWKSTGKDDQTALGILFIMVQDGHIISIREQHVAVTSDAPSSAASDEGEPPKGGPPHGGPPFPKACNLW